MANRDDPFFVIVEPVIDHIKRSVLKDDCRVFEGGCRSRAALFRRGLLCRNDSPCSR
jgi:hypothetical protein